MSKPTKENGSAPGVDRFEVAPGYFLVETSGVSSNPRGLRDQVAALWKDVRGRGQVDQTSSSRRPLDDRDALGAD